MQPTPQRVTELPELQLPAPPAAPKPAAGPRLSAVICTYDRYHLLPAAISSLLKQTLPRDSLEIIVVDNSPDQEKAAAFGANYVHEPNLRYVLSPRPGLSEARNEGAARARAKIVAFIDDDAVAVPGWAAGLVAAFMEFGPELGAAGGPARPLWLARRPGWLDDSLLGHLSILDYGDRAKLLAPAQRLVGCNMAFDRELLLRLGGFNPKLGRLGPELSLRSNGEPGVLDAVHQAGRTVAYVPEAAVEHGIDPSRLTQSWFRRRAAWQAVSDYLMDPHETAAHAPAAARYLRLVETSGVRRRPIGFFGEAPDGWDFGEELLVIRELVIATLHGGAEMEAARQAPLLRSLRRLRSRVWLTVRRKLRNSPQAVATVRRLRRLVG